MDPVSQVILLDANVISSNIKAYLIKLVIKIMSNAPNNVFPPPFNTVIVPLLEAV